MSVAVTVTAPVAPLIDTLEPATIDVTPVLLNVVELNDNPVPALYVVFVSVGTTQELSPLKKVVELAVPEAESIARSTAPAAIVEAAVTFPDPSNDPDVQVTSPVIDIVLPEIGIARAESDPIEKTIIEGNPYE